MGPFSSLEGALIVKPFFLSKNWLQPILKIITIYSYGIPSFRYICRLKSTLFRINLNKDSDG
ncbi:MAG: hypothetical protein ACI97X_002248 [Oceanospirillaceae bacterium]|jgi:hypothetical protein